MNALGIYLSTCRYVLQIDPEEQETWQDLYRYLPYLRQSLTCCVCGLILRQPVSPVNVKSCQHHVCKQCVGGKMKVRPSCSWCKEWDQFVENIQLRIILQCFKELCTHLSTSPIYEELATSHQGEKFKIASILEDGLKLEDYKYPAKNKFANISNWPLPHFTFMSATTSGSSNNSCVGQEKQSDKEISVSETNITNSSSKQSDTTSNKDVSCSVQTEEISCEPVYKSRRFSAPDTPTQKLVRNDLTSGIPNFYSKKVRCLSDSSGTDQGNGSGDSRTIVTPEIEETKTDNSDANKKAPNSGQTKRIKHPSEPARKICRCGTANVPNKLTCYCQRCPCYSQRQGCFGCKCRGCRNPYNKKKQVVPIDNSTCQEVNVET